MNILTGEKTVKASAVASDGQFWVAKVLDTIEQLEKDSKHVILLAQIDAEDQMLRSKAHQVCQRLRTVWLIGIRRVVCQADQHISRSPATSKRLLGVLSCSCLRFWSSNTATRKRKMTQAL
jgi:hypothetical protein